MAEIWCEICKLTDIMLNVSTLRINNDTYRYLGLLANIRISIVQSDIQM